MRAKVTNDRMARKIARKNGCSFRNGKGSHVNIYSEDGKRVITIPKGEFSRGVSTAVTKAFALAGFIVLLVALVNPELLFSILGF